MHADNNKRTCTEIYTQANTFALHTRRITSTHAHMHAYIKHFRAHAPRHDPAGGCRCRRDRAEAPRWTGFAYRFSAHERSLTCASLSLSLSFFITNVFVSFFSSLFSIQ